MQHADFRIGTEFYTEAGYWRCTDIGTRVIIAIRLDAPDASWYTGPPYAVAECVLDEDDLEGCSLEPLRTATERDSLRPPSIDSNATTDVDARTALARLGCDRAGVSSPIGVVRTPHTDTKQIPKGPGAKHEAEGVIEIDSRFEAGLLDIKPYLSSVPAADLRRGWLDQLEPS